MRSDVTIRWAQTTLNGTPLNRWAASIEAPVVVRDFASLNLESGIWQLRISRQAGRATLCVPYRSERLAKKHLERWMQYHWQTVGGFFVGDTDPRGREGRSKSGTYYSARMRRYLKDYDLYAPHHR